MVVVPAGAFMMGSPSHEHRRDENEGPVHQVRIGRSFAVGVYEVTVAEFGRFVDEAGYSAGNSCWTYEGGEFNGRAGRGWRNPGFGQGGRHPAACVSWNDAQAYAAWLSRETGAEYRLPSESEWEHAARAVTAMARPWGEDESGQCRHANGADASLKDRHSDWPWSAVSCRDGHVHTAPVGSFAANGWGLHDMLGNVWEWTGDCWNGSYAGAPGDGSAWQHGRCCRSLVRRLRFLYEGDGSAWEHGRCCRRVLRGGSWSSGPRGLRSAFRRWADTGDRAYNFGFRVARTLSLGNL